MSAALEFGRLLKQAFELSKQPAPVRPPLPKFDKSQTGGPTWGQFGHELVQSFNPWNGRNNRNGTLAYADKWYNPATTNKDPMTNGEHALMRTGQVALGTGAAAGATAAGIAAAPAAAKAFTAAAPRIGQAYRGYKAVTAPLASHAVKALPQAAQPAARLAVRGAGLGMTGHAGYQAYNSAANATSDAAQNVARSTGIQDPKVLSEIGSRARSQMLPIAYKSFAPAWAGGDNTPVAQQIRKDMGTLAYHNISPAMLRPSPAAANQTLPQRALQAVAKNPVNAVSSAVFSPRPSAQQMWNNVPQQQRQQIPQNLMRAAQNAENSPLAKNMQHIFEPATQYHQQQLGNTLAKYLPRR
jgi:hypothetical protein